MVNRINGNTYTASTSSGIAFTVSAGVVLAVTRMTSMPRSSTRFETDWGRYGMAVDRAGWMITASLVKGWISRKVPMSRVAGERMLA